jgi:hypothetical protein
MWVVGSLTTHLSQVVDLAVNHHPAVFRGVMLLHLAKRDQALADSLESRRGRIIHDLVEPHTV